MKLLAPLFFACSVHLFGSLVSTPFVQNDLRILEELDIKPNYLTDYKLQQELQEKLEQSQQHYAQKLNSAYMFIPQIKKILKENQIPSAFLYLVMAESEFVLDASSNKKAKGLWQFMPKTANHFGLQTNEYIDERMDIVKSTQAAVTYLKRLHDMFDKWYLAAVAYNCGEGRVIEGLTRAIIDMHCEDVTYKVCRKDSKILEYRQTIKDYQNKKIGFSKIGKIYNEVKNWGYNPDIDQLLMVQSVVDRQYIPDESRAYIRKIIALALMNNSDFLLEDQNLHLLNRGISDPIATISIQGGVRLKDIATLIGIEEKKLQGLNLHIKTPVLPFQESKIQLYIPYSKLALFNQNKENLTKLPAVEEYVVKAGDSLSSIGRLFDMDYKKIKSYNDLSSNILKIGQKLLVPIDPTLIKKDLIYTVQVGDTLSKIANSYNITLEKLMKDNDLKTSMIRIGDSLVVKYK